MYTSVFAEIITYMTASKKLKAEIATLQESNNHVSHI